MRGAIGLETAVDANAGMYVIGGERHVHGNPFPFPVSLFPCSPCTGPVSLLSGIAETHMIGFPVFYDSRFSCSFIPIRPFRISTGCRDGAPGWHYSNGNRPSPPRQSM